MSNYSNILKADIANGEGWGVSLFLTGCDIHCNGCFNKDLWDPNVGKPFTSLELEKICQELAHPYYDHLAILGGEPLCQWNYDTTLRICKVIRSRFENTRKIWIWSGFNLEDIKEKREEILEYANVLISGPFIEAQKDLTLLWRGSRNQIITMLNK